MLPETVIETEFLCIVMELCQGGTLAEEIRRKEKGKSAFSEGMEIIPWLAQMASALEVFHYSNIIHRDLKPANILLITEARPDNSVRKYVKIADLGLAKRLDE